jgi:hypothetical protein
MSRIPPHAARMVGDWPASRRPSRVVRPTTQARRSVLAGVASLARTLHVLRAGRAERRRDVAPLPPQRA